MNIGFVSDYKNNKADVASALPISPLIRKIIKPKVK